MKKLILLLSMLTFFVSCDQLKKNHKIDKNLSREVTIQDKLIIDRPMAVLVLPTKESLEQTKEEIGTDYYQIYYDDGASIMNDAATFLEKNKIEQIEKLNNEIIIFQTNDGKLYTINLADKAFTTLLFNGKESPKELFSENLETDESILKYMQ